MSSHIFKRFIENDKCSLLTSEVSQVPLDGVKRLLEMANREGIPSLVDMDVRPSIAYYEANLGDESELFDVLSKATVVKPTIEAAMV